MSPRRPVPLSTPADAFLLRLREPIPMVTGVPQLGDDRLLIRIGHPDPLTLIRFLPPHFAGVVAALELGRAEVFEVSLAEVLAALAAAEWGIPHAAGPCRLALVR